jgi:hypothetical protein
LDSQKSKKNIRCSEVDLKVWLDENVPNWNEIDKEELFNIMQKKWKNNEFKRLRAATRGDGSNFVYVGNTPFSKVILNEDMTSLPPIPERDWQRINKEINPLVTKKDFPKKRMEVPHPDGCIEEHHYTWEKLSGPGKPIFYFIKWLEQNALSKEVVKVSETVEDFVTKLGYSETLDFISKLRSNSYLEAHKEMLEKGFIIQLKPNIGEEGVNKMIKEGSNAKLSKLINKNIKKQKICKGCGIPKNHCICYENNRLANRDFDLDTFQIKEIAIVRDKNKRENYHVMVDSFGNISCDCDTFLNENVKYCNHIKKALQEIDWGKLKSKGAKALGTAALAGSLAMGAPSSAQAQDTTSVKDTKPVAGQVKHGGFEQFKIKSDSTSSTYKIPGGMIKVISKGDSSFRVYYVFNNDQSKNPMWRNAAETQIRLAVKDHGKFKDDKGVVIGLNGTKNNLKGFAFGASYDVEKRDVSQFKESKKVKRS